MWSIQALNSAYTEQFPQALEVSVLSILRVFTPLAFSLFCFRLCVDPVLRKKSVGHLLERLRDVRNYFRFTSHLIYVL